MATPTISKPAFERVQIERLTRVALILSSIAAIPALLLSPLVLMILLRAIIERDNLVFALGIVGMMVVGWWLYWSYWRAMDVENHQGKVSWLVSALFNGGLAVYQVFWLYRADENTPLNWLRYGVALLWVFIMTVISVWVWVLKVRETLGNRVL
jgi:hypothetical protein